MRLVKRPILDANMPLQLLSFKERYSRVVKTPNSDGTLPEILFASKLGVLRYKIKRYSENQLFGDSCLPYRLSIHTMQNISRTSSLEILVQFLSFFLRTY